MRTVNPAVERAINGISPLNPYGEPVYRAIWSADALHWVAGWWPNYEKITGLYIGRVWEARQVPRYQHAARWMIEKWLPPEHFGTPEQWNMATEIVSETNSLDFELELGPYPARGMYSSIWTCSDANGNFMELTPTLARMAVSLNMQPIPSEMLLRSQAQARQEKKDADFVKYVDNIIGDPFPFLGRTSNVSPRSLMDKIIEQKKSGKELL